MYGSEGIGGSCDFFVFICVLMKNRYDFIEVRRCFGKLQKAFGNVGWVFGQVMYAIVSVG